jgi:hypothetical protein
LSSLQDVNEVFVIGVFSGAEVDGYKAFMKLAAEDDLHVYVVSTSTEVASKLAVYVLIILYVCGRTLVNFGVLEYSQRV